MSGPSYAPFLLKGLGCRQREWLKLEGKDVPELPTKRTEEHHFSIHVRPSYYNVSPDVRLFPSTWHMDRAKKEAHVEDTRNLNAQLPAPAPMNVKVSDRENQPAAKVDVVAPTPSTGLRDVRLSARPETTVDEPPLMAGPIAPPVRSKSLQKKTSKVLGKEASWSLSQKHLPSKSARNLQSTEDHKNVSSKPRSLQNPSKVPNSDVPPVKITSLNGLQPNNLNDPKKNAAHFKYKLCRKPVQPTLRTKLAASQVPTFGTEGIQEPPPQFVLQKLREPPALPHIPPSGVNRNDNASRLSDSLKRLEIDENVKSMKRQSEISGSHEGSDPKKAKSASGIENPSAKLSPRGMSVAIEGQNNINPLHNNEIQPMETSQQRSRRLDQEPKLPVWAENVTKDLLSALCVFAKKSSILSWSRLKQQDIAMFLKEAEAAFPNQQQFVNGFGAGTSAGEPQAHVEPMDISESERRKTNSVSPRRRPAVRSSRTTPDDDVRVIKDLISNWNKLVVGGDPNALVKMNQSSEPLLDACLSLRDDPEHFSDSNLVQLFSHFGNATVCTEYLAVTTDRMIGENTIKPSLAVRRFCRWSCQLTNRLEEYFKFCWKLRRDHRKRIKLRDSLVRIYDVWRDVKARGTKSVMKSFLVLKNCAKIAKEKSESDRKKWNRIYEDASTTWGKLRSIFEQTISEHLRQASTSFDIEAENHNGRSSSQASKKISSKTQPLQNGIDASSAMGIKSTTPTISNQERAELELAKTNRGTITDRENSATDVLAGQEPHVPVDRNVTQPAASSEPEPMAVDDAIVNGPRQEQNAPPSQPAFKHPPRLRSAPLPIVGSGSSNRNGKPVTPQATGSEKPTSTDPIPTQGQGEEARAGSGLPRQKNGILRNDPKASKNRKTVGFSPGVGLEKSGLGGLPQRIPRENIETLFSDRGVDTPSSLLDPNNDDQRQAVEERIREMSIGSVLTFFGVAKAFAQGIHESRKNLHAGITDPIEPPVSLRLFDARALDRVARMPPNGAPQ